MKKFISDRQTIYPMNRLNCGWHPLSIPTNIFSLILRLPTKHRVISTALAVKTGSQLIPGRFPTIAPEHVDLKITGGDRNMFTSIACRTEHKGKPGRLFWLRGITARWRRPFWKAETLSNAGYWALNFIFISIFLTCSSACSIEVEGLQFSLTMQWKTVHCKS